MSVDSTTLPAVEPAPTASGRAPSTTGLVVMERPGPGEQCVICTVRVAVHTESVAQVRGLMGEDLLARGLEAELVEDGQVIVTELLTNAFRHARTLSDQTMRVRWKVRPESLEVEVTDGGSATTPHPLPLVVWRDHGRGLRVVRAIAHEWGVGEDRTGQVVWATLGGPSRRRVS